MYVLPAMFKTKHLVSEYTSIYTVYTRYASIKVSQWFCCSFLTDYYSSTDGDDESEKPKRQATALTRQRII